jgi:hypothetical protein
MKNNSKNIYVLYIGFLLFCANPFVFASVPLQIQRINEAITIDGQLSEPVWQKIVPLPVIMHQPVFGNEPTQATDILIAYDDRFLYVGGRLYDTEPDKIQATSLRRDGGDASNDWFGIILDTFNDKENGLAFFTTPSGLRLDMTILNDGEGDNMMNESWNTFWDVATRITNDGWFVEMRIPFSSLRFQSDGDSVKMGLISWRWIARSEETIMYPAIPPDFGFAGLFKPSQAKEVLFHNIYPKNPFYFTPYLLGGFGKSFELNEDETQYIGEEQLARELGLDAKFSLASNMTLDLSVNTDFAQVEADDEQINLTRFSLFFPEKRLFFQERSSNFEFNFNEDDRLFYSRRIGIHDGDPVPIYGGARLVGRAGGWDLGLLSMQTAPYEDLTSENFSVLRLRKQVINPYSYVGNIITNKIGTDGSYNTTYGLDGIFRLFGNDYLALNWAQTFGNDFENNPVSLDPARMRLQWERRTVKNISYDLGFDYAGLDYNPEMGFELREDYTSLTGIVRYGWIPGESSKILRHRLFLDNFVVYRNRDRSIESIQYDLGWFVLLKRGHYAIIDGENSYESVIDSFNLSDDVFIPPGEYRFNQLSCQFVTPTGRLIWLDTQFDIGTFYDGTRFSITLGPYWKIPPHIQLDFSYQFDKIHFDKRKQRLDAHIARLRLIYMFNTKLSVSSFIQYNNIGSAFISNLRLRYNISEGHDFYIVYDEAANLDRFSASPYLPYIKNRTLLLKYLYTFRH